MLFSCGGRADGEGNTTSSQQFALRFDATPQILSPDNALGSCFTVTGKVLDIAPCTAGNPDQQFVFGGVGDGGAASGGTTGAGAGNSTAIIGNAGNTTIVAGESAAAPAASLSATVPDTTGEATAPATATATGMKHKGKGRGKGKGKGKGQGQADTGKTVTNKGTAPVETGGMDDGADDETCDA